MNRLRSALAASGVIRVLVTVAVTLETNQHRFVTRATSAVRDREVEGGQSSIISSARDAFAWAEGDRRFVTLVATIGIPLLLSIVVSILPNHIEQITPATIALAAVILFGVIFQIIATWRLTQKPDSLPGIILRCDETEAALQREISASHLARSTAERLTHLQSWALVLYKLQKNIGDLDNHIQQKNRLSLYDFFETFLAPLHKGPHEFFGFDDSDRWNICVYLHFAQDDELRPVWRRTDPRHPSAPTNGGKGRGGFGRHWKPGVGHTGMAFRQEKSFITEDIKKSDLHSAFVAVGSSYRNYDPDVYRSFASIPFGDKGGKPIGVLVITSNRPGSVSESTALPLRHAAAVFTNLTTDIVTLQELLT